MELINCTTYRPEFAPSVEVRARYRDAIVGGIRLGLFRGILLAPAFLVGVIVIAGLMGS